ncbi:MAG: hypothetical protein AAF413_03870 [Patescibacteria group bacterium]
MTTTFQRAVRCAAEEMTARIHDPRGLDVVPGSNQLCLHLNALDKPITPPQIHKSLRLVSRDILYILNVDTRDELEDVPILGTTTNRIARIAVSKFGFRMTPVEARSSIAVRVRKDHDLVLAGKGKKARFPGCSVVWMNLDEFLEYFPPYPEED